MAAAGRQDDQRDTEVVDREDPQHAPGVEIPEVVLSTSGVEQDAGDEKTRQDEEEVDSRPGAAGNGLCRAIERGGGRDPHRRVVDEHRQHGEPSDTIQGVDSIAAIYSRLVCV
jgi:hypothetical protein